ncbi:MAG: serine acetyltransferase [Oscillospiraceae bacterium]|nr:serine acetyltransferase [Oscillospiraceae bacterium]
MGKLNEKRVNQIVQTILEDYEDDRTINKTDLCNQPDKEAVIDIIEKLLKILYPGYFDDRVYRFYSLKNNLSAAIEDIIYHLNKQIKIVLRYNSDMFDLSDTELEEMAENITYDFMEKIPQIRSYLETDVQAAFDGDPAARSKDEVILSYPGVYAISVYRIAHELFVQGVPMIPRIMTEHAHSITGIDIHPGATIGKYFFIDHGTGIVIGETTVIGEHVKMYQGVTLGGLSTSGGQKLKGVKRHPTIKDNVTLYSGSSILGGDTVIEENVVVGGNTFVTKSIASDTRVSIKEPELQFKNRKNTQG